MDHLTRSSLHLMDSDDATILAKSVDMEFGDFEEEPKQHVSKRLRLLPPSEVTDVAMVVADAIKATLMAVKEELAADRAAAHASNSHVLSAQPKALAEPDPSHFFCVNGHTVKTVCTAMDRSLLAAEHAQRLCKAAANVFETEAKTISDAKVFIRDVFRI